MVEGEKKKKERILITGSTGYIGSWILKQVLDDHGDRFKIRCSTRSLANPKKLEPLKEALGEEAFGKIEWVEAVLENAAQLKEAIKDCDFMIHTASPVPSTTAKETYDNMVRPTEDS